MNIIEKVKNLFGEQKIYFKKYALTFTLIAVVTIFMFFVGFESENVEEFFVVMALTTVLVFVIESFLDFKWYRIPLYIIALLLAIATKELIKAENLTAFQGMCIAGLYISIFLLAIYKVIKNSNLKLSQYLVRVLNNNIILGIATFALQMGVSFITLIISTLLFTNSDVDIFLKAEILLLGFFIIPAEILCLLNVKKEPIKPIDILICYIILPIVTLSEIVIYMYFIKILVLWEIPSNRIFPIISALFVFAFPTWIMINNYKEKNKFFKNMSKIIPLSFILLIAMQIYAVGVRILEFGLTPERYLGIILIVFEIFAVILSLIKEQKHLNKILIIASVLLVITMCIPVVNVLDASSNSQLHRLTSVYKEGTSFEKLSKEDKEKVVGAYEYLKYNDYAKDRIPEYINADEINKYDRYSYNNRNFAKYAKIQYTKKDENINVEGFKNFKIIEFSEYYYNNENMKTDNLKLDEFKISQDQNTNKKIEEKIKSYLVECMQEEKNINENILIDENNKFVISYLYMAYDTNDYILDSLTIQGYMLTK